MVWRLFLSRPKANLLDKAMVEALTAEFVRAQGDAGVKAILLEGEGANFSFGASVQEHLPDQCEAMLRAFHGLLRAMLAASIPTVAVVRGQCLGGGLELAAFCNRVIVSHDARLGQPEITLGVFAPVASVILAERMGRGGAEDLLLSGRSIDSTEALRLRLADDRVADPAASALTYVRTHIVPHSASSLRLAVRAARAGFSERCLADLERAETLYLRELMRTEDAVEGLKAFLEKRAPEWRDR